MSENVSIQPLDQIQALVWMNSMLVLPEQSAAVHRFTCCLSSVVPSTFRQGSFQLTRFHFCKQPEHSIARVQVPVDLFLNCCSCCYYYDDDYESYFCFPS